MYFPKKTDYDYDLRLLPRGIDRFWYGALLLALIALPLVAPQYLVSQATFVGIFAIAGLGLALLTGYTGQFSIGHAAFMGVGAYATAVLEQMGVPFVLALPAGGAVAAFVGLIVGIPALRLSGMYLAIGTLAFAFLIEEILTRWESVTRGASGMAVKQARARSSHRVGSPAGPARPGRPAPRRASARQTRATRRAAGTSTSVLMKSPSSSSQSGASKSRKMVRRTASS